jgi:hypothetical protein
MKFQNLTRCKKPKSALSGMRRGTGANGVPSYLAIFWQPPFLVPTGKLERAFQVILRMLEGKEILGAV